VAQAGYWYEQGQRDAIAAAVKRVEALPIPLDEDRSIVMDRIAVIAAIKVDQP
jgi:hypothetical protein